MNILVLSSFVPYQKAAHAGAVAVAREIETLRQKHCVTVLTFYQARHGEDVYLSECKDTIAIKLTLVNRVINTISHPHNAWMFANRCDKRMYRKLCELIRERNIEAIHAEYAAMGWYSKIKREFPDIRFNLVLQDVTLQSYERKSNAARGIKKRLLLWQMHKIGQNEKAYCENADAVITFTDKDKKMVEEKYQIASDKIRIINTIKSIENLGRGLEEKKMPKIPYSICFVGQMKRPENYEAAEDLIRMFQKVVKKVPKASLFIIGNEPPQRLKDMKTDQIHITGFVEDLEAYMSQMTLAVFPLQKGAGIKIKVLLSMQMGIPVITTDIGAEGIDENGTVIELADSEDSFIEKMIFFLQHSDWAVEKGNRAKVFADEKFSWRKTEEVLDKLYG